MKHFYFYLYLEQMADACTGVMYPNCCNNFLTIAWLSIEKKEIETSTMVMYLLLRNYVRYRKEAFCKDNS